MKNWATRLRVKQIKQLPDPQSATRLAASMREKGRVGAAVDGQHLPGNSLNFLSEFPFLEYLIVRGPVKDLDALLQLPNLKELTIQMLRVKDFDFLAGLPNLRLLALSEVGSKDFGSLGKLHRLIGLNLFRLRSLDSVDFLGELPHLQYCELSWCAKVTQLPDLALNHDLRLLSLDMMNGLLSLEGIESAPQLEHLSVVDAKLLPATEFKRVNHCPALKGVMVGLDLTTSTRYKEALSYVPEEIRLDGSFCLSEDPYIFNGYTHPADQAVNP